MFAAMIAAAGVFTIVTQAASVLESHSLLIGESIAVFAFGRSWFWKRSETEVLFGSARR